MSKTEMPSIRFYGFDDAWEQRKLGDIAPLRGGFAFKSNEYCSDGVPIVRISNILLDGSVGADFAYYDEQKSDEMYTLYNGAVVLAMSGATTGKVSVLCAEKGQKYYQNQRVGYFIPTDNCDYGLIKTITRSQLFADQLAAVLVAGAQPNVSSKEIDEFGFMIPKSKDEQHKMGDYFSKLDHLITLHQGKFEKLTNVKKSMLEKMFPQNGNSYPEIRFKGFTGAWEQRKLDEMGSVSMCRRIFKEQTSDTGDIPFFKIGTFGAEPDAFISKELFEEYKSKYPYPQKGDILISASGSIGKTVEFSGNNEYFQDSNIVWLSHDKRLSNPFLKYFYSVVKWAGIEGSTIKRLYNDNILNTVICMPSVPEQNRIGTFFENLDHLITLHQRELEKLQNIKKSMLEKMFV